MEDIDLESNIAAPDHASSTPPPASTRLAAFRVFSRAVAPLRNLNDSLEATLQHQETGKARKGGQDKKSQDGMFSIWWKDLQHGCAGKHNQGSSSEEASSSPESQKSDPGAAPRPETLLWPLQPQSHLTLVGDLFGRGRDCFPAICSRWSRSIVTVSPTKSR